MKIMLGMFFLLLIAVPLISSAQAPSIKTIEPSEVNEDFATVQGEIIDLGSFSNISVNYRYKKENDVNWSYTKNITKDTIGIFQYTITDLKPDSVYEYEFLGYYNDDKVKGGILTFETNEKSTLLNVDFEKDFNVTILIIVLIIAGLLFYLQQYAFSSLIIIISGFVMMTSKVNIILSLVVILTGFLIMFMGGNKE